MALRHQYLEKLEKLRDKDIIKIITGVRRCGKSTLLRQFSDSLIAKGVPRSSIIYIQLDRIESEPLLEYHALYRKILESCDEGAKNYVFLDEVQLVPDFQKAVVSLFERKNMDIYLTGSNAGLLSGEMATLLSGRYIEISMLPLSFAEYAELTGEDTQKAWPSYFRYGGFPYLPNIPGEDEKRDYLQGLYHTVLLKDIMERHKVQDPYILESVLRFLFDNTGNLTNTKKIADSLTSYGRKTTPVTVEKYLRALEDAFIIYRVGRYDLQGKQHLKMVGKFYVVDMGLRWLLLGNRGRDIGPVLENIVFLELLRRGCRVYVGRMKDMEIDFIAEKNGDRAYYQVAASIMDPASYEREMKPLKEVNDNYPKYVLTMDTLPMDEDGIRQKNILDFLQEEKYFQ